MCRDSKYGQNGATCCERKGPTAYFIKFLVVVFKICFSKNHLQLLPGTFDHGLLRLSFLSLPVRGVTLMKAVSEKMVSIALETTVSGTR